jgi:hypothetical protein
MYFQDVQCIPLNHNVINQLSVYVIGQDYIVLIMIVLMQLILLHIRIINNVN